MSDAQDIVASARPLDLLIRRIYWVGYRARLGVHFVLRPRSSGAYVAVWLNGCLLLIRNSYKPRYTLPCGKIERGETAVEAARRELREEVGLEAPADALRASFAMLNFSEYMRDSIQVFDLHLEHPPAIRLDGREVVWAGFRQPDAALELPLHPAVAAYLRRVRNAD